MLFLSGLAAAADLDRVRIGEPEMAFEGPLQDIAVMSHAIGEEEGEPVMFYTVAGSPASFHVVALHDYRLKATYPLPGASRSWAHVVAPDGSVYIGGVATGHSAHLYRYRLGEGVEDLGVAVRSSKFIWALVSDDDGNIYGGTWSGGRVFRYDPGANKFSDYGRIQANEDYVRTLVWHDGFLYAGTGVQDGRVWRIDPKNGEKKVLELPERSLYEDRIESMGGVYDLQVADGHLFVRYSWNRLLLIYDLEKEEWWEEMFTDTRGMHSGFLSKFGEAFYVCTTWGMRRIDLQTRETRDIRGAGAVFRGGDWIDLPDGEKAFASVIYNGSVSLVDPERNFAKSLPSLAVGQATPIQTMEIGPDENLYLSGYMGTRGARIDPQNGSVQLFGLGQAEGIGFFGERIFWGEYPGAVVHSSSLENPRTKRTDFRIGHDQDRPFVIAAGEDRVFFGSVPGYGMLGGALTVYEPGAEEDVKVFRNLVPNQSIVGLAYRNGKLYGSTSIHGGLGIEPTETRARVFVWDVDREEMVASREVQLPGAGEAEFIGGLTISEKGEVFGAVNGAVFVLDPESLEVVRHRVLYPEISRYGRWRPVHLRWGEQGLLYANIAGRISLIDPETLDFRDTGARSSLMVLGKEGTLYFTNGADVWKMAVDRN